LDNDLPNHPSLAYFPNYLKPMKPETRLAVSRVLAFIFVVALGGLAFRYRYELRDLAGLGYLGVFLLPLLANATVFIPIPGVMVIFSMAAVLNPWLVAIIGGIGAACGELTGYLVGFSGQGLAEKIRYYDELRSWMESHPKFTDLIIMVFAAIPNPFFDAAGIAAGSLKIPVWRFLIFCMIGSIIKMLGFAFAGQLGLNWLFPTPPAGR
jgi:membrane protein DedA with SNARE-associated domain